MKHHITLLDESFVVDFTANVTYPGHAPDETDPGGPIEFTLEFNCLTDASGNSLPCPGWLQELIIEELENDTSVYDAIADENR